MRLPAFVPIAAALGLVAPAAAQAATVAVPPGSYSAVYQAAKREVNDLTADSLPGVGYPLTVADAGARLSPRSGCEPGIAGMTCFTGSLDAFLGDGPDRAVIGAVSWPQHARVWGGAGDDAIRASTVNNVEGYGEGGDDTIYIDSEGATADGGAGNDSIRINSNGPEDVSGGTGDDYVQVDGGGQPRVVAGPGNDTVNATMNVVFGGTAEGGDGNDVLTVRNGTPSLHFGWTLRGGAGKDTLTGGPNDDTIGGGHDADVVHAVDGGSDTIACGAGKDIVHADPSDVVAPDCERVLPT